MLCALMQSQQEQSRGDILQDAQIWPIRTGTRTQGVLSFSNIICSLSRKSSFSVRIGNIVGAALHVH